ncbi:toxin transporter [Natronorubrum sp. A-ect3]|uniref:toxin transporter n=1 Tax=Natronorubrum sp. A-ect3 TaxID=3242698 RepID=UPI00359CC7A2
MSPSGQRGTEEKVGSVDEAMSDRRTCLTRVPDTRYDSQIMKRALSLALTVALIGSLAFMGFAGTAAADATIENNADVDQETTAETDQAQDNKQYADQDAKNYQNQDADQQNNAWLGDNIALSVHGDADAENTADQSNDLEQDQDADIDQDIDQDSDQDQDADTEAESEFDQTFELQDFINFGF